MNILKKIAGPKASRHPVRVSRSDVDAGDRLFTEPFSIGRDASCDIQVDSSLASRRHIEVSFAGGTWLIRDLESTNGTYVEGRKIEQVPLKSALDVQLGKDGPSLRITVESSNDSRRPQQHRNADVTAQTVPRPEADPLSVDDASRAKPAAQRPSGRFTEYTIGESEGPHPSAAPKQVGDYIEHYFNDDGRPAGDHTILIRQAYAEVQRKERRKYTWALAGAVLLAIGIAGFAGYQRLEMQRQERAAAALFLDVKDQALATAQFKAIVEETGNAELEEQLAALERRREQMATRYEGYVKELGVYRRLSEEEQVIYDVARIFNESEFQMPAGFVREVRRMIDDYWLQEGKGRFIQAVKRAEENGYTRVIVETMQRYGLPPEFFYLALQESNFDPMVSGPRTRWGIAKGMWQFIPSTARRFGLQVGPREDMRVYDPQDERHDFVLSTDAAARYVLEIYSTLAQASGLLVIASYNWGEHRVVNKLESLPGPQSIPVEAFDGIPEDPRERNYWRFLGEYSDRMPDETKDYVLKIFAAAVIGQNPRLFGIDLDNPLQHYIERIAPSGDIASAGDTFRR